MSLFSSLSSFLDDADQSIATTSELLEVDILQSDMHSKFDVSENSESSIQSKKSTRNHDSSIRVLLSEKDAEIQSLQNVWQESRSKLSKLQSFCASQDEYFKAQIAQKNAEIQINYEKYQHDLEKMVRIF